MVRSLLITGCIVLLLSATNAMVHAGDEPALRVAAAAIPIRGDDCMPLAGGIHPQFTHGEEAEIRASAVIIEKNEKICIVACDVLALGRDVLDSVCRSIEIDEGIPFDNILITSNHTHHAPSTVTVHGYERDEVFTGRLMGGISGAVHRAAEKLKTVSDCTCFFALGQEATVGQNSRVLLDDGTVLWVPLSPQFAANRPTGPFDPELPVIMFKDKNETVQALLFNHSSHNIGSLGRGRSPGFYGLAAQSVEYATGGISIFLPGAFGSTHNMTLPAKEMKTRIECAVLETSARALPRGIRNVHSLKREITFRVRYFDEAKEEEAVSSYCRKRWQGDAEPVIGVFRRMRKEMAERQGEMRKTWVQVMTIGDIAFVGVPGELFTSLGMEIKRRSPFRYTYIVSLANDAIGYIPDERAFELGGYQVWTGIHSVLERGAGEKIVETVDGMLGELYSEF